MSLRSDGAGIRVPRPRIPHALLTLAAVLAVLAQSGCAPATGASAPDPGATALEQRAEVSAAADAVIRVTGLEGRWRARAPESLRWPEDRELILDSARSTRCAAEPGGGGPTALLLGLWTEPLDEDPLALADRVRDHWAAEGWEVVDIGDPAGVEVRYIRAEGTNGAMMTLKAGAIADRLLILSLRSECSGDRPSSADRGG